MKNSLFKRAVAAVATVPLALTQCLSIAQAVYVDEASSVPATTADTASNSWTLDNGAANSIFYISPDETNEKYDAEEYKLGKYDSDEEQAYDGYYYQDSVWNLKVIEILNQIAASDARTAEIDATPVFDKIIANAGSRKDDVASLLGQIKNLKYVVTDNGDITVMGELENVVPVLTEDTTASMSAKMTSAIDALRKEYSDLIEAGIISDEDFPSSDNVGEIFKDLVIGCTVKAVIKGSDLAEGTLVNAEVVLTDTATGKEYKGTGAIDWALDSIEKFNKTLEDAFVEFEQYGVDQNEVKKKVSDSTSFYVDKLNKVKELESKALSYSTETYTFGTTADAIAKAYEIADSKKAAIDKALDKAEDLSHKNLPNELPRYSSVSEVLSNSKVMDVYAKALNNINERVADIVTFDISPEDIGIFADGAYDISVSVANGVATLSAKFPDAEADEAAAFVSDKFGVAVEAKDIYKKVDVTADFSTIQDSNGGSASVQVDFQRIVPFVTTTTTTTATSTTTTTTTVTNTVTTADENVGSGTTTTADENAGGGTTTTTADENAGGGTTTTTADENAGDGTTTTTADENAGGGTTTTTADENAGGGTTTTTADENAGNGTTTTTVDENAGSGTTTTTADENIGSDTTTTASDIPGVSGTTTAVVSDVVNVFLDADDGFYLNIDTEFHTEQVKSLTYRIDRSTVYIDENGEIVGQEVIDEGKPVNLADSFTIKNTPAGVYNEVMENGVKQFVHNVPLYATKDIIDAETGMVVATANQQIKYFNGAPVGITAYVGVKGDADFDLKADSTDASAVLMWYAVSSTSGGNPEILENTKFSTANLALDKYPLMDDFAAFLCDVDNENMSDNWYLRKPARKVDSSDASFILVMYAKTSTGYVDDRDTWNDVLGKWGKY